MGNLTRSPFFKLSFNDFAYHSNSEMITATINLDATYIREAAASLQIQSFTPSHKLKIRLAQGKVHRPGPNEFTLMQKLNRWNLKLQNWEQLDVNTRQRQPVLSVELNIKKIRFVNSVTKEQRYLSLLNHLGSFCSPSTKTLLNQVMLDSSFLGDLNTEILARASSLGHLQDTYRQRQIAMDDDDDFEDPDNANDYVAKESLNRVSKEDSRSIAQRSATMYQSMTSKINTSPLNESSFQRNLPLSSTEYPAGEDDERVRDQQSAIINLQGYRSRRDRDTPAKKNVEEITLDDDADNDAFETAIENDTDYLADTPKSSHSNALPQRSNIRQKANMKNFAQLANKTLDAESKVLEKKQYSLLKKFESFIDEELASIETKPAENTKTYSEAVKNKEDDSLKNEIEAQKSLLGTESLETLPSLMKDTSRKVWCYNWNGKIFLPGSAEMTPFMEQGLLEIPDFVHPETDLAPGSSLTISQLMASPSSRSRPPPPHNPTIQTTLNDVQNSPTSPKQTPAPPGAGAESAPAVYDYNQHNLTIKENQDKEDKSNSKLPPQTPQTPGLSKTLGPNLSQFEKLVKDKNSAASPAQPAAANSTVSGAETVPSTIKPILSPPKFQKK